MNAVIRLQTTLRTIRYQNYCHWLIPGRVSKNRSICMNKCREGSTTPIDTFSPVWIFFCELGRKRAYDRSKHTIRSVSTRGMQREHFCVSASQNHEDIKGDGRQIWPILAVRCADLESLFYKVKGICGRQ